MNSIAIVQLGLADIECENCYSSTTQVVRSSISDWQEVSDSDLLALERHLTATNTKPGRRLVLVRKLDANEVACTIEECLVKVREAEDQAQKRREAAERAARKAEATKVSREEKRQIKQFERLRKDLEAKGVLSKDGSVTSAKTRRSAK